MRLLYNAVLAFGALIFIGCGGGSSSLDTEQTTNSTAEPYINKNLPTIDDQPIPDILLSSDNSGQTKKLKALDADNAKISDNFKRLRERAAFFYEKQLEMNMDLGHIDSVWDQIETVCADKTICNIPDGNITFEYTASLYQRDIKLIDEYEEKTGKVYQNEEYKGNLKSIVGKKFQMLGSKLLTNPDNSDKYAYELVTEFTLDDYGHDATDRITIKWSKDRKNYLVRAETISPDNPIVYSEFEYSDTEKEKISIFSSNIDYETSMKFIENSDKIHFIQDEPNDSDDMLSYYAEGELDDSGGYMTVVGAGLSVYEEFDEKGILISTISCIDPTRDFESLPEDSICSITGTDLVKSYITKSLYGLGLGFSDDFKNSDMEISDAISVSKNILWFDANDTLYAIVDCSEFTADYNISDQGIVFSNIVQKSIDGLQCIDTVAQDAFREFLEYGYRHRGYDIAFDMWPIFDNLGSRDDFNITTFKEKLYSERYVNSPTMNNLFKVNSWEGFFSNPTTGMDYFIGSSPSMKIEDDKIHIDLLDATFEADIIVVGRGLIRFENIARVDKEDVEYPDRNCTNESGPNECMDGEDASREYDDKSFADVIQEFLNNQTVHVSDQGVPNSGQLWIYSDNLSFIANY